MIVLAVSVPGSEMRRERTATQMTVMSHTSTVEARGDDARVGSRLWRADRGRGCADRGRDACFAGRDSARTVMHVLHLLCGRGGVWAWRWSRELEAGRETYPISSTRDVHTKRSTASGSRARCCCDGFDAVGRRRCEAKWPRSRHRARTRSRRRRPALLFALRERVVVCARCASR